MASDLRRILIPVRVPDWMGSVRFRLAVVYSVVLFGLAAAVVGGIYAGLSASLSQEPVHTAFSVQEVRPVPGGLAVQSSEMVAEMQSLEELVNQRALEQLRTYSFAALGALFLASLVVGWVVAGRALAPIHRITSVARDIQAEDLHRRIDLGGPNDELRELADTFDGMLERIDEAFESQRRFVQEASHELRNPLAVIRTNLDVVLADSDATTDELREAGSVVLTASDRMGRLVDDLLVHARQEVPSYEMVTVDMAEIIGITVAEFRAPAEARGLRLVSAPPTGLLVFGDRVALRRALANLLANAVRLAPTGSEIQVDAGRNDASVWVAVIDAGPGIAPAFRDKVFDRFWRGDPQAARSEGRSGLGLAIVRQIVEVHQGRVELTSNGTGSRFTIWLPLMATEDASTGTIMRVRPKPFGRLSGRLPTLPVMTPGDER